MIATAPVTQDVLTLPRRLPAAERINLVGMTRAQLAAALVAAGTPEKQARMRTAQLWQWIYQKGVRDFALMTNLAKPYRALLAARFDDRRAAGRAPPGLGRRNAEIPDADRRRPRGRGRLYPRGGSRHAVHFLAGRLHADLFVLPYRHAEAGAQPDRGEIIGQVMVARDDLDEWPRPGEGSGERPRLISNIVLMGMGEPLYNFENVRDAMKIAMDGEGIAFRAGASRCRPRAWCPRSRAHRGDRLHAGGVVPCHHRRGARPSGADQQAVEHRRSCSMRCAPIPRRRIPNGSPSNT
jgi:23S rRNA (adenine2503-C2)-methyltransferase